MNHMCSMCTILYQCHFHYSQVYCKNFPILNLILPIPTPLYITISPPSPTKAVAPEDKPLETYKIRSRADLVGVSRDFSDILAPIKITDFFLQS